MNNVLLRNPNYIKIQRFYRKFIPYKLRKFLLDHDYFLPLDFIKWTFVDFSRPKFIHPYGLEFFIGLPGAGKTLMMSKRLLEYRKKFGDKIYISTNYGFKYEDFPIKQFSDLLKVYDKPIIFGYDEIQNDFDAHDWKSTIEGFSERITQSRKMNGMQILATAQRFTFVNKRLRMLVNKAYVCKSILGRLTITLQYPPLLLENSEDSSVSYNHFKVPPIFRLHLQSDKLRNSYDSYQILSSIKSKIDAGLSVGDRLENIFKEIVDDSVESKLLELPKTVPEVSNTSAT